MHFYSTQKASQIQWPTPNLTIQFRKIEPYVMHFYSTHKTPLNHLSSSNAITKPIKNPVIINLSNAFLQHKQNNAQSSLKFKCNHQTYQKSRYNKPIKCIFTAQTKQRSIISHDQLQITKPIKYHVILNLCNAFLQQNKTKLTYSYT